MTFGCVSLYEAYKEAYNMRKKSQNKLDSLLKETTKNGAKPSIRTEENPTNGESVVSREQAEEQAELAKRRDQAEDRKKFYDTAIRRNWR